MYTKSHSQAFDLSLREDSELTFLINIITFKSLKTVKYRQYILHYKTDTDLWDQSIMFRWFRCKGSLNK